MLSKTRGKRDFDQLYTDLLQVFPFKENSKEEYEIVDRKAIGYGAYGNVYKTIQKSTKTMVAMKKLGIKLDDFYQRVNLHLQEREVLLLKKIKSHPFIIKYIDSFSDDQQYPYIITELAELGSLE